ncbi:DUF885 family protein [Aestuariibaculum sediminum]|uniref:DUF885 family protein n=1 Tax=Aestuariibaculum sediminum TaxID=2770637 RepID=A0A8J6UD15_9FLAO|nr:DUF885 family protein [Aestuariibaculum sediminum]MBD0832559.1 DUF885 family protein [Aestuariibaculum sediminum]
MKIKLSIFFLIFFSISMINASELIDLINSYTADKKALEKAYLVRESETYYNRLFQFHKGWNTQLKAINFNDLSTDGKVDYILLNNLLKKEAYQLSNKYKAFKKVVHVSDFAEPLYTFIKERKRGKEPDSKKLAGDFNAVKHILKLKTEALKKAPFENWMQAEKAAGIISSLQYGLQDAYEFYFSYDPEFTWWVKDAYAELNDALKTYREFLMENYKKESIKDDGSGIIGQPVGREALIKDLEFEFIPYAPEELISMAEKQFNWCKDEMIKASKEMGFGNDWKAALEHVKNTYVEPGKQPQAIKDLYDYSVNFIEERDLITIPELAKETWGMIMMTPERQKVNPFFTGGWEISISYPTVNMGYEDKMMSMRGNNPNFSFPTVQHELHPGHNLQFYMNARHKSYRRAFDTPFWMEGWALYWEIALWNKGFPQTPEQKMGMLFWRIHRCARIVFSLKYQLGEWTPQQCIDMLVNQVGHEYANAKAEVRRSFATSYTPPLYQMAYMTGGLQFYALKKEMLDKGWTEKQFHDRVLKENFMPVELLRSCLQEKPLKKDFKSTWKFSTDFN